MKKIEEVLAPTAARLFRRLQTEPLLAPFTLIGGTALALHLGHRRSEDLDYICRDVHLPRHNLERVAEGLRGEGWEVLRADPVEAEIEFINAGMELHDFSQTFSVEGVQVTFFTADREHEAFLPKSSGTGGPNIASVPELSAMKALVARSRSNSRDWLDLYILQKERAFGLSEWLKVYQQVGLNDSDLDRALARICSGVVHREDPGFHSLLPDAPTVAAIASAFSELRDRFEVAKARERLPGDT